MIGSWFSSAPCTALFEVYFQVRTDEVIEIDDGIVPYYFCVCKGGADVLTYFDRDRARKNKYEEG